MTKNSNANNQGLCLVLGCGDVGFEVAGRLKERGLAVAVVEKDARLFEQLRISTEHDAYLGDFRAPDVLKQAGISQVEAVIITVPDLDTIKETLQSINRLKKKLRINPVVIVRVEHEMEEAEVKALGASDVVSSTQTIAHAIVEKVNPRRSPTC